MAHDILIVDDEADIRMLIAGVLKDEGYATREAADSTETLMELRARQPTLVILDIWLQNSEMDGVEILRQLRSEMPSVPVVMISGHGTIETAVEAIKIGAYDFIEKPFKTDRLLLIIARAIETALLRRENEELKLRAGGELHLVGAPLRRAVCRGQLRDDASRPARTRTVRLRNCDERLAAQNWHIRARPWRYLVPRRGRRYAAGNPGQDRAGIARADLRAARRIQPGRGRCPR